MGVRPGRLPKLLTVLVLAFAPMERRPLLAAVELFRGMAIQLAFRWPQGWLLAESQNRAVLLWSVCRSTAGRLPHARARALIGVGAGVLTGLLLFALSNLILLSVVTVVLHAAGVSAVAISEVRLGIVVVRLTVTAWRATAAARHDHGLDLLLKAPEGARWRLDYLAALPEGRGHGGRILQEFLELADASDAEVALHCDESLVGFYRRHGFRLQAGIGRGEQRLMLRSSLSSRRARRAPARLAGSAAG